MPAFIFWIRNRRRDVPNLVILAAAAFGVAALAHVVYHGLRKATLRGQVALIPGGARGGEPRTKKSPALGEAKDGARRRA